MKNRNIDMELVAGLAATTEITFGIAERAISAITQIRDEEIEVAYVMLSMLLLLSTKWKHNEHIVKKDRDAAASIGEKATAYLEKIEHMKQERALNHKITTTEDDLPKVNYEFVHLAVAEGKLWTGAYSPETPQADEVLENQVDQIWRDIINNKQHQSILVLDFPVYQDEERRAKFRSAGIPEQIRLRSPL